MNKLIAKIDKLIFDNWGVELNQTYAIRHGDYYKKHPLKYDNPSRPFQCEHDELIINVDPQIVSEEDKRKLDDLGIFIGDDYECFKSFRYGSA